MKKFLAFLMAAVMLLSVAVAEGTTPDPATEAPAPSSNTEVEIAEEPSKDPAMEGEVAVTRDLFAIDRSPEAIAMVKMVLEQIESDEIDYPVEAFTKETQAAVLKALGVGPEDVAVPVLPFAIAVNDEAAKGVTGDQLLILANVFVNSKFAIVLSVKAESGYAEYVLAEVDADPDSLQVYAKVDVKTLQSLCKADVVVATVLSVKEEN